MQIELLIEGNAALADAVDTNHGSTLQPLLAMKTDFEIQQGQPLPLAVLGPQCAFRRRAIQQLEMAKIQYRVAASSPSLDGLWAALLGSLGITARTALNLREGLVSSQSLYGLPLLGSLPVTLHRNAHWNGAAADRMALLFTEALGFFLSARPHAKWFRRRIGDVAAARKA